MFHVKHLNTKYCKKSVKHTKKYQQKGVKHSLQPAPFAKSTYRAYRCCAADFALVLQDVGDIKIVNTSFDFKENLIDYKF